MYTSFEVSKNLVLVGYDVSWKKVSTIRQGLKGDVGVQKT